MTLCVCAEEFFLIEDAVRLTLHLILDGQAAVERGGFVLLATGFRIARIKEFPIADMIPAMILMPVPPLYMLAGFVLALMLSVFPAAVSMVIDARHPKLNWMSETDALKKNFNSFFCIVLWVVAAAVTAITAFLLSRVSPAAMLAGLAACAVILCAGSLWFLNRAADQCNTLPED